MALCDDIKQRREAELLVWHDSIAFPAVLARYMDVGASLMHFDNIINTKQWLFPLLPLVVPRALSVLH